MQKFIYETKCCSCGRLNARVYADATDNDLDHFKGAMIKHANGPHPYMCPHCGKETLHNVVSYGVGNIPSGNTGQ
jgi:hypothetical protein